MFDRVNVPKNSWLSVPAARLADQWCAHPTPQPALRKRISKSYLHTEFPDQLPATAKGSGREQKILPGGGCISRTRVAEHGEEIFNLIEDPKTHVLHVWPQGHGARASTKPCPAATARGLDWSVLPSPLKKADRWHVETY